MAAAKTKSRNILGRISYGIVTSLENAFHTYGSAISKRPFAFIVACLALTGLCSIGLINFTVEERPFKLWIPQNSDFMTVMAWQKENFPAEYRLHVAIYEADNVLDKSVILEMLRIHEAVANASTPAASWSDVCAKMPTITNSYFSRRRRSVSQEIASGFYSEPVAVPRAKRQNEDTDWSTVLDRDTYCGFYEKIDQECMEHSILELWGYDRTYIENLTPEEIIDDVTNEEKSAVFGFPTNFTEFLGDIVRDEKGRIIKAGASRQIWITHINLTAIDSGEFVDDTGTGMEVDKVSFDWEKELIDAVLDEKDRPEGINLYLMASSSFGMISQATIMGDVQYLAFGFGIMFMYVQVMLGKFNLVEQRPVLSLMGLSCVGMSIFTSYGICSAFGVPFGPVNNILPFLLLGLGIDDMFVIMQAWNNLDPSEKKEKLGERIGLSLKHAGVSITVTSVTDFAAFAIGSGTVLPALRSFCLYAAVGIAAVYAFQATFFVAWFALDQQRLEDKRHGFLWFWKPKNWTPNQCSQKDICQTFFHDVYAKYLFKLPSKISVILITIGILAVSGWGLSNLRQEFNPIWFLPQSSYLFKFFMKQEHYYPTVGEMGTIYFGKMNYFEEMPKLEELITRMEASDTISEVDSWFTKYKEYWEKQGFQVPEADENEEEFLDKLSIFLHSPSGSKHRIRNFRFDGIMNCTDPAPPILASSIEYRHHLFSNAKEQIHAMDSLKALIKEIGFDGEVNAWARIYSGWETDKIIEKELYTNMGLAMMVVFLVTLVLIANFYMSLMVLLCVIMTLIDVGALMHWWGLTIDTVSCIDLVLAIGLCVDYAAHVGHTFMKKEGSRDERARLTVATIGPAVLNGGVSTFLAFIFLANSDSHVFITFFKIFFGVVIYGLFHGLVFLPVILSMCGPASYLSIVDSSNGGRGEIHHSTQDPISDVEGKAALRNSEEKGVPTEPTETDSLTPVKNSEANGCVENGKDRSNGVALNNVSEGSEMVTVLLDPISERSNENTKL
ncbi:patched domain-containing protein 3-like isoform X1 [Palaemon carinicauda]|uniref:patched domain-containing protein 3-like isoform X1 n=1 Tax=Palaemon carinicauda TaxID=392227 RepID=UPI0035B66EDD